MNSELETYFKSAEAINQLRAVIIGQDPYPQNPSGIAFCKNSFKELLFPQNKSESSGKHLLYSLGITQRVIDKHSENLKKPSDIFHYLLEKGIAVTNVSFELLDAPYIKGQSTEIFRQKLFEKNTEAIEFAYNFNISLLKKTKTIYILGKLRTKPIFERYYSEFSPTEILVHPSQKNSKNENTKLQWTQTYESHYLREKIRQIH